MATSLNLQDAVSLDGGMLCNRASLRRWRRRRALATCRTLVTRSKGLGVSQIVLDAGELLVTLFSPVELAPHRGRLVEVVIGRMGGVGRPAVRYTDYTFDLGDEITGIGPHMAGHPRGTSPITHLLGQQAAEMGRRGRCVSELPLDPSTSAMAPLLASLAA
ncbi:hypothetical protein GQ53DRAFT_439011 [Thozetella sp. PMI_491]|nr:hypothetical protein GQ53DRAFT_439011 [Thozetella sp. PMI_491]